MLRTLLIGVLLLNSWEILLQEDVPGLLHTLLWVLVWSVIYLELLKGFFDILGLDVRSDLFVGVLFDLLVGVR